MIPVPHGFDVTLLLWLNLAGTFTFGLSGGLAAVRARLDLFGVLVLAAVVGLAGGITRDLLIGVPPSTFRDWHYLAAVGAAGLVSFFGRPALERRWRLVQLFDAMGLALVCVTGASRALAFGLGPAQAIILGAISSIGGGILRDVLLRQVPTVLRQDLYAVPAVLGAAVVTIAHEAGATHGAFAVLGAGLCFGTRLLGIHRGLSMPLAPSERRDEPPAD
ncbi:MAG: trimeric intracellular cation channel family protein [Acidimicrobiia bacterium]|nr:trimeric intracellular cation channel family protein [Acidimicrobiia bacterium]